MKLRKGSLQKKNGWFYFVDRDATGKVRWQALRTQDPQEAAERAAVMIGDAGGNRADWLRALVKRGEWARQELEALDGSAKADRLDWDGLFEAWQKINPRLTRNPDTLENYELIFGTVARWAKAKGIETPAAMTPANARAFVEQRQKVKATVGRDVEMFRRMWRDLRIGPAWTEIEAERIERGERYRRLTVAEVRRLVELLRKGRESGKSRVKGKFTEGMIKPLPDVADMVTLAYHTGLRRGDVAALTTDHIDGDCLRVAPLKTRGRKPRPLVIPLQPEAMGIVRRLAEAADPDAGWMLFPRLADASLGKCLRLAFERAGIRRNAFGRASFHSLRATFISLMDEAGVPPHMTDAITGHAAGGMHGRYTQPGREALMEAVEKAIPPLDSE